MFNSRKPSLKVVTFVANWLPASETFVVEPLKWTKEIRTTIIAGRVTRYLAPPEGVALHKLGFLDAVKLRHFSRSAKLERLLERLQPDIVHAHFGNNGAYLSPILRRLGLPLVVTFHGHDVSGLFPVNRRTLRYARYQHLVSHLFETAALLVCSSRELSDRLGELGAPPEKLVVHHLGIDIAKLDAIRKSVRKVAGQVICVGRLVAKKGTIHAIRAFAKVRRDCPGASLVIVGGGPEHSRLVAEVCRLDLTEQVHFRGVLNHDETLREIAASELILAPSCSPPSGDRESGLIVLKEAFAMAVTAVATRHGGIPEIVSDNVNGFLVEEHSSAALVEPMRALLLDAALRERMGEAALSRANRDFAGPRRAEAFEQLLFDVAAKGKTKHKTTLGIKDHELLGVT
jgi:colanic acid/amylovoran biosynthesis glycosyltransferase